MKSPTRRILLIRNPELSNSLSGLPCYSSRLHAPTQPELSRKRKCVSNPPIGKRKSRSSTSNTDPKKVTPERRVCEYSTELFVVSNKAVVNYGEPFVKGTYNLEGDGLMVFTCTCYEEVNVIINVIHFENIPNVQVRVLGNSLSHSPAVRQQLLSYTINCVTPGLEYFQRQLHVQSSLKAPLEAFKAARLFSPHKLSLLCPSALSQVVR